MCSTAGLPPAGACLAFRVTRVDTPRPGSVLAKLWGRFQQRERQPEYQRLHSDIQSWAKAARLGVGSGRGAQPAPPLETNERCLVDTGGEWHRARVLSRVGDDYTVFTLDEGRALPVRARSLDRGKKEFFQLPPEVVCCILANLVPAAGAGDGGGTTNNNNSRRHHLAAASSSSSAAEDDQEEPEEAEQQRIPEGGSEDGGGATTWSPGALSFFRTLQGRTLEAQVEAVLPNRLVLIEVARVSRQLCELGLARPIDPAAFRLMVEMSTSRPCGAGGTVATVPPPPSSSSLFRKERVPVPLGGGAGSTSEAPSASGPAGHQPSEAGYSLNYFYPLLQVDETVTVRVTHVRYPDRFFCQLRCHCPELERLHDSMHRYYDNSRAVAAAPAAGPAPGAALDAPRRLGSPCAAKSADGRWYRALVQQTLADGVLEVFYVDYGDREVVPARAVRKLSPGYFKMPVVTYPFALRDASDYGRGWSPRHIELLKSLILRRVLQAKVEYYSSVENVYFVTLRQEDGSSVNAAFNAQAESLLTGYCEQVRVWPDTQKPSALQCGGDYLIGDRRTEGISSKTKDRVSLLKNANLKLNAFYDVLVEFVKDPSEFWIRTMETASEFEKLMNSIAKKYANVGRNEGLVKKPEPGLLCCAKFKADNLFYRAVITEILDGHFRVFFIDYGNMEVVDWHDVKVLLPEYRKLPALAVKCCLADLTPKDGSWSREAIAYFEKAVFEKHLVVHVLEKEMDKYLIELLDVEDEGEPSVNKLILLAGYADRKELKISNFNSKNLDLLGHLYVSHSSEEIVHTHGRSNKEKLEQRPMTPEKIKPFTEYCGALTAALSDSVTTLFSSQSEFEGGTATHLESVIMESPYKQEYLKVGSTVDVQVSYIDEPGDFWCQMTKNTHELKILMSKIQEYYNTHEDSFQPGQSACIVRYSEDGKWYRALILGKVTAIEVDVLYIDFGNRERVPISELRLIKPEFLLFKGQAFRCSLYNIIQPMGPDPFMWNEDSIAAFQEFIDNALSLYMELKCTVYALTVVEGKGLCNVVDLNTPFQSACQLLIERGLAKFVGSPSILAPSVSLYTYYYSTHDVKIGSEEEMYVSHVASPTKFYCLLGRNLGILDKLADKVNKLSSKMQGYTFTQGIDPICLAKYTDNRWYRALAWPMQDRIRVSFVDYGNKLDIDKDELLPIPNSAKDVKFLPMQAIKCGLSDIPVDLSLDIIIWFKKAVMDKPLKAVVVAKETDGKLIVELYDGNIQINAKIKEQLCLQNISEIKINGNAGRQKNKNEKSCSPYLKSDHDQSPLKRRAVEDQGDNRETEKVTITCKQDRWKNRTEVITQTEETGIKKGVHNKMYTKNTKEYLDVKSAMEIIDHKLDSILAENSIKKNSDLDITWPKLTDLPLMTLSSGFKSEVSVSHVISPSHFFVQLLQNEDKVTAMEEKLNASNMNDSKVGSFQIGNVVCAEFPEDGSQYRAVITQVHGDTVSVEYIDYGNTATVDASKVFPLPKDCLEVHRLSIPCFLAGFQDSSLRENKEEAVSEFIKRTNKTGIMCEFIQPCGQLWEVNLHDDQGSVVDLLNNFAFRNGTQCSDPTECPISDVRSASKLLAHVSAVNSPQQFWCQFKTTSDGIFTEAIEKMKDNCHNLISKDDSAPKAGVLCMVKSKANNNWATCEIVQVCNRGVEVLFLKEGIREEVNNEDTKEVTPAFTLTYECKLHGLFPVDGNSWSKETIEFFKALVLHKTVTVKVISISEDNVLDVTLYDHLDKIVSSTLISSGLGVEKPNVCVSDRTSYGRYIKKLPLVGQTIEGYITAAESPSYFWCQYSSPEVQMLSRKMQEVGVLGVTNRELLSDISVDDSCFCKYCEDGQWYRAEVKKVKGNIISLQYVDYGNEDDVGIEQMKKMPKELLKIPTQSFPCCLSGYDLSKGSWKDGAVDALLRLSDQLLKITVVANECKDTSLPSLLFVQIQYVGGVINDIVRHLWNPHVEKYGKNCQVYDKDSLCTGQLTPLLSSPGGLNREDKRMQAITSTNGACSEVPNSGNFGNFSSLHNDEEKCLNPPVNIPEGNNEFLINIPNIPASSIVDGIGNDGLGQNTSKTHEPAALSSIPTEDTIETVVVGNFEDSVSSGPDEGMLSTQPCMDQYSLSNQIEDADLEAQGPFEASEHLQASVQSIDLYEEIFNCQQNQPFTEEIGDDSMTRILISHDDDDDYYDQNVSELQVNTSETEDQFETGLQIAITEESAIKEKDIPLKDPFTGMEKESSSLILQADHDICVDAQSEKENQSTGSSYSNPCTDVSQKKMVGFEVHCEKDDDQMRCSHVATTADSVESDKEQLIDASIKVTDTVLLSTESEIASLKHFIDQNQKHQLMPIAALAASEK